MHGETETFRNAVFADPTIS